MPLFSLGRISAERRDFSIWHVALTFPLPLTNLVLRRCNMDSRKARQLSLKLWRRACERPQGAKEGIGIHSIMWHLYLVVRFGDADEM
mmetsp:Transcript_5873/g.13053  ORF Transcript_5873/g.13053 Transcript_5873/m.13053 type:complete len:88 (-) Transcript_5873:2836-3099(-)